MEYPIGKKRVGVPTEDQNVIIAYSIPVKCPKSKGLQGQQSSAVESSVDDLIGVDFLHMSISAAPPKYPL